MGSNNPRFSGSVMVAAAVLAALAFPAGRQASEQARFWRLALRIQVQSDFQMSPSGQAAGTFFLEVGWAGFLEEDGPDFIVYHLGSEPARWELKPEAGPPSPASVPGPELRLNYVEGKEEEIIFYYDFNPEIIDYPGSTSGGRLRLILPAVPWPGKADKIPWFNRRVIGGERNLSLPRKLLDRSEARKEFNWEEEVQFQEPGSSVISQKSRVRVALELVKCK